MWSEIDRVVGVLADFYPNASTSAERAAWGRTEKLRISTDENFEQVEPFAGELISRPALESLRYYTDRFYSVHARLLNERRADGRIVNGHGDLHLEHVYLMPDRICIYDCIEFNERFRAVDVANDVAFLAMDLDFNDRPNLARYFGRTMAQRLEDGGLLRLLDFYKCYRAVVRGKVEGMRSTEDKVPEEERTCLSSARRSRETYDALTGRALAELTEGKGVVLDATYSKRDDRDTVRAALRDGDHEYVFFEMTAEDETVRDRLQDRDSTFYSVRRESAADRSTSTDRMNAPRSASSISGSMT